MPGSAMLVLFDQVYLNATDATSDAAVVADEAAAVADEAAAVALDAAAVALVEADVICVVVGPSSKAVPSLS